MSVSGEFLLSVDTCTSAPTGQPAEGRQRRRESGSKLSPTGEMASTERWPYRRHRGRHGGRRRGWLLHRILGG